MARCSLCSDNTNDGLNSYLGYMCLNCVVITFIQYGPHILRMIDKVDYNCLDILADLCEMLAHQANERMVK